LLLDRGADRGRDRADFLDRGGDALDRLDGFLGGALDLGNAGADLLGGFRGLAVIFLPRCRNFLPIMNASGIAAGQLIFAKQPKKQHQRGPI
jgi:hypothetical protein